MIVLSRRDTEQEYHWFGDPGPGGASTRDEAIFSGDAIVSETQGQGAASRDEAIFPGDAIVLGESLLHERERGLSRS